VVTLPQLFKSSGYTTARVGKIYHYGVPRDIGTNGQDDSLSWDRRINPIGIDKLQEDKITNYTPQIPALGGSLALWAAPGEDGDQTDGKVADEAVNLLDEYADRPFFLAVGFFRPHTPFVAPKKYFDLYPIDQIKLPEERDDDWDNKPTVARSSTVADYGLEIHQRKEITQAYYASISFMDAQVGKLLDKLDELKLSDNTIIVFWSDHGYALGQHGLWQKQTLFEHTARVPLLISVPGYPTAKRTLSSVELIDLYPTLADLAHLPAPNGLQGKSLVKVLQNPDLAIAAPAYTQIDKNARQRAWYGNLKKDYLGRSVRYKQWRYTEWNGGEDGIELYNYETDPNEFFNLATDAAYKEIVAELKVILRNESKETK